MEGEGVVNEDLPNSWICFKCNTDGKERHLKVRMSYSPCIRCDPHFIAAGKGFVVNPRYWALEMEML